jgi:hypothetical protein
VVAVIRGSGGGVVVGMSGEGVRVGVNAGGGATVSDGLVGVKVTVMRTPSDWLRVSVLDMVKEGRGHVTHRLFVSASSLQTKSLSRSRCPLHAPSHVIPSPLSRPRPRAHRPFPRDR